MSIDRTPTSFQASATYLPIEDYAVIGDLHTVALVGKNGSIDWCCIPRFDSPSVFGAILDANKGGFFRIVPYEVDEMRRTQLYLPETNILMTRFLTVDGVAEVTDFMPIKQEITVSKKHHIVRSVAVVRGTLSFEMICRPAFNYARDPHTIHLSEDGAIFHSQHLSLALLSSVPTELDTEGGVRARFTLRQGQSARFVLESAKPTDLTPPRDPSQARYLEEFHKTSRYWQDWLSQCQYQGRWREMVQRSALVLKLLTYAPTGAIVAAATTSLPEAIGSSRNWDYRYTWLRDSSFTLYSLLRLGFTQEAEAFMGWLENRCKELGEHGTLQPMYTIDGKHDLPEFNLDHLEGYRHSAPVRIGNAAYKQKQLDIYGEMMDAVYISNRTTAISYDLWKNLRNLLDWLSQHWQEPDEGIWEVRGGSKNFLHSRLMCWVAFDRAIRLAQHRGLPAPIVEWTKTSASIYEEIMAKGWNEKIHSFTQYYGSTTVDASALLMVLTHFASPTDPRMLKTVDRIRKELSRDSLVRRYDPYKAASDGLNGLEGTFNMCSFWLAEVLAHANRIEEARIMLEKMLSYSNHVGLYSEEIGATGEALGNFPQAFTHLSLITACLTIDEALNKKRPAPGWAWT